jgi:hypothetical protein
MAPKVCPDWNEATIANLVERGLLVESVDENLVKHYKLSPAGAVEGEKVIADIYRCK